MGPVATAELIADGGAAAAGEEFFRSPEFHEAEGLTDTLRIAGAGIEVALAVAVRPVAGSDRRDAVSAYGYPGAAVRGATDPLDAEQIDWSPTGLVSLFVRERASGPPFLAAPAVRSRLQVHDPGRPRGMRRRLAEQVRRNARLGYRVDAVEGPAAEPADVAAFHAAYTETMRRAGAAGRYLYERSYFTTILRSPRARLLVVRDPQGEPAGGAVAAVSDGVVHYYLGGTADRSVAESPFKNVMAAMLDLADELGLPLNLGGGVQPGDGLDRFKRGFANAEWPFRTHEVVCDPVAYEELAAGREAGGFFPAYRAT